MVVGNTCYYINMFHLTPTTRLHKFIVEIYFEFPRLANTEESVLPSRRQWQVREDCLYPDLASDKDTHYDN
jgi:hypothetical protein